MITRQARTRLGLVGPFVGDGLLAVAIAVAAGFAASMSTSSEPADALLIALAAGASLTLAVRRLYPMTVLVVVVGTTAFFAWKYGGYWPYAAVFALYNLGAHSPRRRAIIAGAAALLTVAAIVHSINWQLAPGKLALLVTALAPLVAAWVLGDNVRTRRAYVQAIEDRAAQLEREQEANARRAAAEEQARIAREVHDIVAHNLSVIIVQATAADAVFDSDPADAQRAVRTIGSTARQALSELRPVLGVVRSGEERSPDFPPQPTLGQLRSLVERVRTAGLAVELEIVGEPRQLPPGLELSAYRIVQEALTNTLRHADATHATVKLRFGADSVDVEIVDDGRSSAAGNGLGGRGLVGMRERTATFGGEFEARHIASGGFRVAARLPFDSMAQ